MRRILADLILQNIEFFSLAPDSDVHPDAAVRQLETIANRLKDLPKEELDLFFEIAAQRLEKLQAEGASNDHLELMKNLRDHLGV